MSRDTASICWYYAGKVFMWTKYGVGQCKSELCLSRNSILDNFGG